MLPLEHHPQTRLPWCNAVMPAVIHQDVRGPFLSVIESLWGYQPVQKKTGGPKQDLHDDLAQDGHVSSSVLFDWVRNENQTTPVVFFIRPDSWAREVPWPPLDGESRRKKEHWQQAHLAASAASFRLVDRQVLADLIRGLDLLPIDLPPTTDLQRVARYVVLPARSKKMVIVRAGDPPGRLRAFIKVD